MLLYYHYRFDSANLDPYMIQAFGINVIYLRMIRILGIFIFENSF